MLLGLIQVILQNLLRGTGLAANPVAGDIAALCSALCGVGVENLHHALRGVRGDNLALIAGIRCHDDIPVSVHHVVHHMGLHQIAAVGHCTGRRQHMDRGDAEVLAEGFRSQLHGVQLVRRIINGGSLAGQVNAGFLRKAKGLKIFEEALSAQLLAQVDKEGVAGVAQTLHKGSGCRGHRPSS